MSLRTWHKWSTQGTVHFIISSTTLCLVSQPIAFSPRNQCFDQNEKSTTSSQSFSYFHRTHVIYDSVQDIKRREQEELADVLRQLGTRIDDGYEYHFEDECPIVAAYDYDEPCDVVILSVRVDDDGYISLVGDEKNDRGNPHSLDVDDIFAGHLEYVTSYILQ